MNGPDADDINPSVNTTASVEALYGTITNGSDVLVNLKRFLAARLAGSYSSVVNIYFIAPNGSDSTGIVNDIAKPYATAQGVVSAGLSAGDLVVYGGGICDRPANQLTEATGMSMEQVFLR